MASSFLVKVGVVRPRTEQRIVLGKGPHAELLATNLAFGGDVLCETIVGHGATRRSWGPRQKLSLGLLADLRIDQPFFFVD
jgi:hypothetical protein